MQFGKHVEPSISLSVPNNNFKIYADRQQYINMSSRVHLVLKMPELQDLMARVRRLHG